MTQRSSKHTELLQAIRFAVKPCTITVLQTLTHVVAVTNPEEWIPYVNHSLELRTVFR
jgi:hypothetical protein